jgi:pimeloyl-ACP methyl ester carboxylesterase
MSPRNRAIANVLHEGHLATLLMDLLTEDEQEIDQATAALRFNIGLLAQRVAGAVDWSQRYDPTRGMPVGLFGASTGAAGALVAAAERADVVRAVVSRGGRPDLSAEALPRVKAPVLLIVGSYDTPVIGVNQDAAKMLRCEHQLKIVTGASHLFEEPGKLQEVARLAAAWFLKHIG